MEQIGSVLPVQQKETVETEKQASQFNVTEFKVSPHNHEIWVEISLFDSEGIVIGPARWVQLNPLTTEQGEPPESVEEDKWGTLIDMTLREINVKVKERLQGMEF